MPERDESARIHSALGHPIRKAIIEFLSENGEAGFKDLKESLKVTVGTLYYHLEILGDLITQNERRKYVLTEKGKAAKKLLESGAEVQAVNTLTSTEAQGTRKYVKEIFLAPRLFKAISTSPLKFLPEALIIFAASAYLFNLARIEPTLILYITQPTVRTLTYVLGEVLVAWFGLFAIAELSSYFLYHRRGGEVALLLGVPFTLLPTLLLPVAITLGLRLDNASFTLLFLPLQAWSFLLLTALVAIVKGIPVEKSSMITLILVFVNLAAYARYLA
jgi:DNA-binding transcriptional ArsR family regulator